MKYSMAFDEREFDSYMTERSGVIFGYIMNKVRNNLTTEDIFQETFLKVYKYVTKNAKYPSDALLYTMAYHEICNYFRKPGNKANFVDFEGIPEVEFPAVPYQEQHHSHDAKACWEMFEGLDISERDREIFILTVRYEMTTRQIAEKLGLPKSTVSDRYRKTLGILQRKFSDNEPRPSV